MGAYADRVKSEQHRNLSPEQISAQKNQRTKQRNTARKAENIRKMNDKKKVSPQEQLAKLDFRLGKGVGAVRERAKLMEKIAATKN